MKKVSMKLLLLAVALFLTLGLKAQDYTVQASGVTKVVVSEVNRVRVETHSGSTVEISAEEQDHKRNERAKGLKPLSSLGEDNTGIGLNVSQSSGEVKITQTARRVSGLYVIKVPQSANIEIEHTGNWEGGKIEVYGVNKELEISGRYNSVYMEDITGPALVNTVYGGIEAVFSQVSQSGAISLESVYGDVDVTIPANTKADIKINTPYGEAFSDLDIKFDKGDGPRRVSSVVEGTINGGGVKMDIKASYQNVYLRKK